MLDIQQFLKERDLKTKMLLQVHDELVFDVPKVELEEVTLVIEEKMSNAFKLSVPLVVDSGTGENWLAAH